MRTKSQKRDSRRRHTALTGSTVKLESYKVWAARRSEALRLGLEEMYNRTGGFNERSVVDLLDSAGPRRIA